MTLNYQLTLLDLGLTSDEVVVLNQPSMRVVVIPRLTMMLNGERSREWTFDLLRTLARR